MQLHRFILTCASLTVATASLTVKAQQSSDIPPDLDPAFWGQPHRPYIVTREETRTSLGPDGVEKTHVARVTIYRDSAGRERTDSFYDSGKPANIMVRDPTKNLMALYQVVAKSGFSMPMTRPTTPPPGKGWLVAELPPKVIAGFLAQGQRFTRIVPPQGNKEAVTTVEEIWISKETGAVLFETFDNPGSGAFSRTVVHLDQTEPDPALFETPSGYTLHPVPVLPAPPNQ